jgi:ATP-dependent Zn protease
MKTFEDVYGNEQAKKELSEIVKYYDSKIDF